MKQGKATHSGMGAIKTEPKSQSVNVESVSDIGNQERFVGRAQSRPLYEGRGLSAPMKGTSTHSKGSQGRY